MKKLFLVLIFILFLFGCTSETSKKETKKEIINETKSFEPSINCTDEDDGKNIYTEAKTALGNNLFTDLCVNKTTVEEGYCNETLRTERIGCPEGYLCSFGKCKQEQILKCTDSDGEEIVIAGGVTYGKKVYGDECTSPKNVKEYSCSNNTVTSKVYECPGKTGCSEGKCIELPIICSDSDNGYNISNAGKVTRDDNSGFLELYDDYCEAKDNRLIENYCDGTERKYGNVTCPTGTQCSQGKCMQTSSQNTCFDSDGLTREIAGNVILNGSIYSDYCQSEAIVKEFYCSNNEVQEAALACSIISPESRCIAGKCTIPG